MFLSSRACCSGLAFKPITMMNRTSLVRNYSNITIIGRVRLAAISPLRRQYSAVFQQIRCFTDKSRRININQLSQKEIDQLTKELQKARNRDTMYYIVGIVVFMTGMCWLAIPLYRKFCEITGYGGTLSRRKDVDKINTMSPIKERMIRVKFNADTSKLLAWDFKPLQEFVYVHPGETALAFFSVTNNSSQPIVGVSTYNIIPYEAAAYFNKIQCFCFDEQLLNPGEQVDMPVFFYLDPDMAFDPLLQGKEEVVLSYTFFPAKSGVMLRRPTTTSPETVKNENTVEKQLLRS